jgi:hypothetical protein
MVGGIDDGGVKRNAEKEIEGAREVPMVLPGLRGHITNSLIMLE